MRPGMLAYLVSFLTANRVDRPLGPVPDDFLRPAAPVRVLARG